MHKVYSENQWIDEQIKWLSKDEVIATVYRDFLERTVCEETQHIKFVHDANYSPEKAATIGTWHCVERRVNSDFLNNGIVDDLLKSGEIDAVWKYAQERLVALNYDGIIPPIPSDEEVLVEYEDGAKIIGLNNPEALRNEHAKSGMKGYFGDGYDNWVLRNRDGESMAMLVLNGKEIARMKGPDDENGVPVHVTAAYLIEEIIERELTLSWPAVIDGYVQTADGRLHDIRDLPKGSVINGDFYLFKSAGSVSSLPDDLTINGSLRIQYGPYFTETPKNLTVTGELGVADVVPLRVIGSGLRVGKDTFLGYSDNLQRIEENVDFGKVVVLSAKAIQLKAEPFYAERIDVIGGRVEQSNVPRNKDRQVVIDGEYLKSSEKAEHVHEIKQLPGLIASVLYDSARISIRNKVRSLKKKQAKKSETDIDGPPAPKM